VLFYGNYELAKTRQSCRGKIISFRQFIYHLTGKMASTINSDASHPRIFSGNSGVGVSWFFLYVQITQIATAATLSAIRRAFNCAFISLTSLTYRVRQK